MRICRAVSHEVADGLTSNRTGAELSKRKDDAAMQKAMDLLKAHGEVPKKLEEMGHLKAAKNIREQGGRWDSPEVRDASKRGGGRDGGRG